MSLLKRTISHVGSREADSEALPIRDRRVKRIAVRTGELIANNIHAFVCAESAATLLITQGELRKQRKAQRTIPLKHVLQFTGQEQRETSRILTTIDYEALPGITHPGQRFITREIEEATQGLELGVSSSWIFQQAGMELAETQISFAIGSERVASTDGIVPINASSYRISTILRQAT